MATKARASASLRKLTTCWSSLTCHGQLGLRFDALTTIFIVAYLRLVGERIKCSAAVTWRHDLNGCPDWRSRHPFPMGCPTVPAGVPGLVWKLRFDLHYFGKRAVSRVAPRSGPYFLMPCIFPSAPHCDDLNTPMTRARVALPNAG